MSFHRLSQRLELDVNHLLWQAKIYGLDKNQVDDRFDKLASTYIALVEPAQSAEMESLLRTQMRRMAR